MSKSSIDIKRQAVIIIHGIGEQRPLITLRDFVKSVAPAIRNSQKKPYHSLPDLISDSYELRRMKANRHADSHATDYYQLYWAHLIENTQLKDVGWWIWNLFVRWPGRVPARLRWAWWAFWISLPLTALLLWWVYEQYGTQLDTFSKQWWAKWLLNLLIGLLLFGLNYLLLNYLGDAVRYMTPLPRNVGERQKIRKAGIDLLTKLHTAEINDKPRYERIVVVGHSLGSVIAYDLINLYWARVNAKLPSIPTSAINEAEQAAKDLRDGKQTLHEYRVAQLNFWQTQYGQPTSWRISDLITAGSPLAFADLYLADSPAHLKEQTDDRELSTSPPVLEEKDGYEGFAFPVSPNAPTRTLHHAAPFAMTRWTNIYFTNDYVGGPVNSFGPGVLNQAFRSKKNSWLPFRSHGYYWKKAETECLSFLRETLALKL